LVTEASSQEVLVKRVKALYIKGPISDMGALANIARKNGQKVFSKPNNTVPLYNIVVRPWLQCIEGKNGKTDYAVIVEKRVK